MNDLPDELIGTGEPPHNGTNDSHGGQDTSQRHAQLSQLLSSNPTQPLNIAGSLQNAQNRSPNVGNMTNTLNSVKSPLSNSLASPPHVNVGKTGVSQQHVSVDGNFSSSSATFTMANNISNSTVAMASSVPTAVLKGIPHGSGLTIGHNQMIQNGPLSGPNRSMNTSMGQNMPNISQTNNMLGNMPGQQQMQTHQSLGLAGLTAAQTAQMMKVGIADIKQL